MLVSRRARDRDGKIIEPMTLANMRENGVGSVVATCAKCRHEGVLDVQRWPADTPAPSLRRRRRAASSWSVLLVVGNAVGDGEIAGLPAPHHAVTGAKIASEGPTATAHHREPRGAPPQSLAIYPIGSMIPGQASGSATPFNLSCTRRRPRARLSHRRLPGEHPAQARLHRAGLLENRHEPILVHHHGCRLLVKSNPPPSLADLRRWRL